MKVLFFTFLILSLLGGCASNPVQKPKPDDAVDISKNTNDDVGIEDGNYVLKAGDLYTSHGTKISRVFYFKSDQYDIPIRYQRIILAHAVFLAKSEKSNIAIRIEGHADERGSREYNLALGEQRARAVADILSQEGYDNYEVVSFGEERPADTGNEEFAWSRNRRVEIIYPEE